MGPTFQKWEEKASHIAVVLWLKPTSHLPSPPARMIHREPPLHLLPAINLCTAWQKSIAVFIRGQITCSIIYNFDYTHFSPSSSFAQTSLPNVLYHSSFLKKKILIAFKRGTLPTPLPLSNPSFLSSTLWYKLFIILLVCRRSYISENTCLTRTVLLFILLTDRAPMGIHLSKNSSGP